MSQCIYTTEMNMQQCICTTEMNMQQCICTTEMNTVKEYREGDDEINLVFVDYKQFYRA